MSFTVADFAAGKMEELQQIAALTILQEVRN
jgi:hypothetical protein